MRKSKEEIIVDLGQSYNALCSAGMAVSDGDFNISRDNKWSAAENIAHLVNATRMTSLAFTLPKIMHVLLYGKPKRTSHGYSKIVENYHKKLGEGAQAAGIYVPKKVDYKKEIITAKLDSEGQKLIRAISEKWTDEQLDAYQVNHPILGLLTVRELAYFTIYHNGHHRNTIQKYYLQASAGG